MATIQVNEKKVMKIEIISPPILERRRRLLEGYWGVRIPNILKDRIECDWKQESEPSYGKFQDIIRHLMKYILDLEENDLIQFLELMGYLKIQPESLE